MVDTITNILLMVIITLLAVTATTFIILMITYIRKLLSGIKIPTIKLPKKKQAKKERRTENMSKEAREGVTFNDIFMFMIAVPLVLLWVGFAGFVIHTGLNNSAVLENIEAYTTLIAILGGPALLIIKDALDVWKQEQAEKTAFYKVKAQAVIDYNDTVLKQAQDIESKQQDQEHKMESKK
jgi:sterol desaturase/sphingolipid hydroxylase (fatty acid hydroxylase superfamily)